MSKTALFVEHPYRIESLRQPYRADQCKEYVVEQTVILAKIDYQNFINDLCVDRWFIEKYGHLCKVDNVGIWHCILVKQKGCNDGILVMSEGCVFPKWAAYLPDTEVE